VKQVLRFAQDDNNEQTVQSKIKNPKSKMKNFFLPILITLSLAFAQAQPTSDALIFDAMKTEMDRSMTGLKMPNMPAPFFVNYIIAEGETISVTATLGSVISSSFNPKVRSLYARVMPESNQLTGDADFNNQNATQTSLAIDNNLAQLRRGIWIASDSDYKRGLTSLTNKRNALRRLNLTEAEAALLDYEKASAVEMIKPSNFPKKTDQKELETLCESLSAEFRKYPNLYGSRASLVAYQSTFYTLTSEGTKTQQPLSHVLIRLSARVRTADGTVLSDYTDIVVADLSKLPSRAELITAVNEFASTLQTIGAAEPVTDYYSGPVLFEGDAVVDIFTRNLMNYSALFAFRRPVARNQQQGGPQARGGGGGPSPAFARNVPLGRKLIDTRFTVINHTQKTEHNGKSLVGAYHIDGEGIVPQASLVLVERGIIRNFLNNRIPTEFAPKSNGNNRIGTNPGFITTDIQPSVLEIQATGGLNNRALRQRLINSAKEEGLDYAFIVRKTSGVVRIYKVDVATGRETLMRSPQIDHIGLRQLRRVDAVSSDVLVSNQLFSNFHDNTGRTSAFPVSVIAPNAILLQDVEISTGTATSEVKPSVKNPLERP
jgi:hypothetical protein